MKKIKKITADVNDYIADAQRLLDIADQNTIGVTNTKKWLANVHLQEMSISDFGRFLYKNRDMIKKTNWIPIVYKGDEVLTCGLAYTSDNVRSVNDTAQALGQEYFWSVATNSLAPQKCYEPTNDGTLKELLGKRDWINKISETKIL